MRSFVLLLALALPLTASADDKVTVTDLLAGDDVVVAHVGGEPVRLGDIGFQATRIKALMEMERGARGYLDAHVFDLLVAREAAAAGLEVEAWLVREVDDKVTPVTEEEARAFFEENPPRGGASAFEDMKPRVISYLERERKMEREDQLFDELRVRYGVEIHLEPYRVDVSADDDPSRGIAVAPVTVVMFFDFQCGFCGRARPTMDQLLELYPNSIRIVYRDYPIPKHPRAQRMAEAANCAQEQGRYFEYADALFANMRATEDSDLLARATEVGLDFPRFQECLDSGRHAAEVEADFRDGQAVGVSGTPAFYVNGRLVSGAQPLDVFQDLIDEELGR